MRDQDMNDSCPSLADLVLASDGGLSPAHKAEMTAHLRRCERCRDRLEQANAFLEAGAEETDDPWRSEAEGAHAPILPILAVVSVGEPFGKSRGTMALSFDDEVGAEYDSAAKSEARALEFQRRLHKQMQAVIHEPPPATAWVRQWLPVAAVITLLVVGLALPRMQAVVRAEELLKLASTHESTRPDDRSQRWRIELKPRVEASAVEAGRRRAGAASGNASFVVDVMGGVMQDAGVVVGGAGATDHAAVVALLARHGFDWRQPLRLDGVRAWRASLGEKRDEVLVHSDVFVIKTVASVGALASTGALREVEVTLRRDDYHVVKLVLAFEGTGRIEIAEVEQTLLSAAAKAGSVAPLTPRAAAPVAMNTVPAPLTRGSVLDAARSPSTTVAGRAPVSQPGLSSWLNRNFGASPERKTFVPSLQRLVGDVRQHLAELDTLAHRYPEAEVEEQWSGPDRAALRRRVEDSYRRMSRDLNDLELRVSVMFGSRTRSLPVTELPVDWRERATLALMHVEAMDGQVRDLMNYDDVPSADASGKGAAQVPGTFGALWDVVHAPAGGPASR